MEERHGLGFRPRFSSIPRDLVAEDGQVAEVISLVEPAVDESEGTALVVIQALHEQVPQFCRSFRGCSCGNPFCTYCQSGTEGKLLREQDACQHCIMFDRQRFGLEDANLVNLPPSHGKPNNMNPV